MVVVFMIFNSLLASLAIGVISLFLYSFVDLLFLNLYKQHTNQNVPGENIYLSSVLRNILFVTSNALCINLILGYFQISSYSPSSSSPSFAYKAAFCIWASALITHGLIVYFNLSKHHKKNETYAKWHIVSNILLKPILAIVSAFIFLVILSQR